MRTNETRVGDLLTVFETKDDLSKDLSGLFDL